MSTASPYTGPDQPLTFAFTSENEEKAKAIIAKYPPGRQASAVLPLLDLAQRQGGGWLSVPAMDKVAAMLGMAPIRVYEVASFYEMFNTAPVGKHMVRVCTTTPCWLRGSDAVLSACKNKLGVEVGETTADGQFTLKEFECLGACVNAPVVWIDDDFYEDLDASKTEALLEAVRRGEAPKPGPQVDRLNSAPVGGATTLKSIKSGGRE